MDEELVYLGMAIVAVILFPMFAISAYNWRDRRHSRRMNRRKTDRHDLL